MMKQPDRPIDHVERVRLFPSFDGSVVDGVFIARMTMHFPTPD
jgi:hypothetical protein